MRFQSLLDTYRRLAFSERDKGNRFERLMQAFLQPDPKYAARFQQVWRGMSLAIARLYFEPESHLASKSTHASDPWRMIIKASETR